MEKNYAVIFKRGDFVEEKGWSLEAIDYVEGLEQEIKGKKYFMIDPKFRQNCLEELANDQELYEFFENNKKLKFMEDNSTIISKYVYGTPLNAMVFKDLVAFNYSYLDDSFGTTLPEESYSESVNRLKERYVEALKRYNFYQNMDENGEIKTYVIRKEPAIRMAYVSNVIPEMFEEEIGLVFPDDYDFSVGYDEVYKPLPTEIDVKTIYEQIKQYVIGQDRHILPILSAINDNLNAELPEERTNILVCGPTGSGKTAIFKRAAELVGLPIVIEDSTQFTKAGYYGRDVSDIFEDLIEAAGGDIELAQLGIIVIDEIDKKASGMEDSVSGVGVIQSMLKLLEGGDYTYEVGNGMNRELKTFNTLKTTIAFIGAFSKLSELANPKQVGFGDQNGKKREIDIYSIENLDKYGVPPEFVGRITLLEILDKLRVENLKNILLTAKINPLDLFIKKMKKYNTEVIVADGFADAVAIEAHKRNAGARGLYWVMRECTKMAQSEIALMPSNTEKVLTLTPECVHDNMAYELKEKALVKKLK